MCKRPGARMNLVCLDSLKQKGQRIEVWWAGATQGQRVLRAWCAFRNLFVRVAVFPGCGLAPGTSLVLWLVFRNTGKRDEAQTGGVVVVRRAASLGSAEGLLHCCETSWPCRPSPLGFAPAGCYSLGLESHCAAASRPPWSGRSAQRRESPSFLGADLASLHLQRECGPEDKDSVHLSLQRRCVDAAAAWAWLCV